MRTRRDSPEGWKPPHEAIDPEDPERAAFAEREVVGVLDRPMTRSGLEQLLDV